jgi:hypothetical protein
MLLLFLSMPWTTVITVHSFWSSVPLERTHHQKVSTLAARSCLSLSTSIFLTPSAAASLASATAASPKLKSLLKKPSKVLTVGVEYDPKPSHDKNEASVLSMQLRKSKISSIWCKHVEHVQDLSQEQGTAQGNFPGPVPIIYHGPLDCVGQLQEVVNAGASAVVVSLKDNRSVLEAWREQCKDDAGIVELVWKISTVGEAQQILDLTDYVADAFWVKAKGDEISMLEEIVTVLPKSSLFILPLDPMQPDGAEITRGKEWKQRLGCPSVVVEQACVGDAEDIAYAQFLVNGLTSKASTEFKFSGLTGSTNGHFGGVHANNQVKWRRVDQPR